MNLGPVAALALTLALGAAMPAQPAIWIGLEMPAAGIDGAEGLAARIAVRLGPRAVLARDSARGGFLNPHQDEGVDNDVDVREAPSIVASFAADPRVIAAIGGLRRRVGDADALAALARQFPTIVLSRWSRNVTNTAAAYCLCVSPGRLVSFARTTARQRFGRRLLLVLLGEAAELKPVWTGRWGPIPLTAVHAELASVAAARRRAGAVDAVLVLADERPPTLWGSAAFRRSFDLDYVRSLGHREFRAVPASAPAGSVATIETRFAPNAARAYFERRYHEVAGYLPGNSATRAYAAAQILAAAGTTRAQVRQTLRSRGFTTVVGRLTFDADGFAAPYPLAAVTPDTAPIAGAACSESGAHVLRGGVLNNARAAASSTISCDRALRLACAGRVHDNGTLHGVLQCRAMPKEIETRKHEANLLP